MDSSLNVRAKAALLLAKLINHQGSLSTLLPDALNGVQEQDRPLTQELCYGTLRHFPQLSAIADTLLKRPFKPQDADLLSLILVGLYQLREMNVPSHAAISETVEASKQLGKAWATKLINAVLRRYQREETSLIETLANDRVYRYNHPAWMIEKLAHNWPDHWQSALEANNLNPPLCLRVNQLKQSTESYLKLLDAAGIAASPGRFAESALYLDHAVPVQALPGFNEGAVSVQDEAAQLSAKLLAPKTGDRVLDACSAPGGKLAHLLESSGTIELDALELSEKRAKRIEENLSRLQLKARLILGDARERDWWDGQLYNRILLDAPCSATGVIRRNPDIKVLRSNEEIKGLADTQLAILTNLWGLLVPGGTLVYATCSIFPQENERIIERFMKQQPDAEHQPISAPWGIERPYGRQLFPTEGAHDGFYYAVLRRLPEAKGQ